MELHVSPKQIQTLSPQVILSMEILQMGTQELLEYVENAVLENPVLEIIESHNEYDEDNGLSRELGWLASSDPQNLYYHQQDHEALSDSSHPDAATETQGESLYDHVLSQLWTMELEPQLAFCAKFLVSCLDQNGWLDENISLLAGELGQTPEKMEQALGIIQSLEPAGIGARDLSECLCLQLRRRMPVDRLALRIATDYLDALSRDRYGLIARELDARQEDVRRAAKLIRSLNPRPGSAFASNEQTHYIAPDLTVVTFPDHFELLPNEHLSPTLNISSYYTRLLKQSDEEAVRDYLTAKVQQAKWIMQAIEQRRSTLLACTRCILELQKDFFCQGPGYLRPMSLADVAYQVGVHESTVSRAIRGKYLQCSMGVYPLSYFFVRRLGSAEEGGQSSTDAAKALLKKLISQEDKQKPLSDQKLCEQMANQGCVLSRRTVAKYRDELNIPGMTGRKELT